MCALAVVVSVLALLADQVAPREEALGCSILSSKKMNLLREIWGLEEHLQAVSVLRAGSPNLFCL